MGHLGFDEPFLKLRHQGLIMAEDGRKMSKSYGNVINPDDIVVTYGADTLRVYEMFMGPFNDAIAWNTQSMIGARRFLERIWRAQEYVHAGADTADALDTELHATIRKIGDDIESFKFNTAISSLMIFVNALEKTKKIGKDQWDSFLKILAPFAPYMSEELWSLAGNEGSIHSARWPQFDASRISAKPVTYAIQINGKARGTIVAAADEEEVVVVERAKNAVSDRLKDKTIARTVFVPNRLVSFVVNE
jgi:leucyl-tRNA synthetase